MIHDFPSHPGCQRCPLWENASHPGLPTRLADLDQGAPRDKALLVVGEAPGYYEDRDGKTWIHVAGDLLHRLLRAANLGGLVHIYLTNAARCHPPQNRNPSPSQIKICRNHLEQDLRLLMDAYDEVFVLCSGAVAARAAGFKSLKEAYHFQGYKHEWFPGIQLKTFFTYHPAALLPGKYGHSRGRDPSKIRAVVDHLKLVWEVLSGKRSVSGQTVMPERAPAPPENFPPVVALDIETYGILRGWEQTVFHPRQSELIDGIKRGQQVVIVTLSWEEDTCGSRQKSSSQQSEPSSYSPSLDTASPGSSTVSCPVSTTGGNPGTRRSKPCPTDKYTHSSGQPSSASASPSSSSSSSSNGETRERHAVFVWKDWGDRRQLHNWVRACIQNGSTLLGKHFLFDLMYLRYNDPILRYLLNILSGPRIEDLEIWNHLDYELRPEKSLKPLAELLGVASYRNLSVSAKAQSKRAKSPYDPELWRYGATDTAATLRARSVFLDRIARRSGPQSRKLSDGCREFHSNLLWSCLLMSESGFGFDVERLSELHCENQGKADKIAGVAERKFGVVMKGTGSRKSQLDVMSSAYSSIHFSESFRDSAVEFTPKTRQLSINDSNINYFLTLLHPGDPLYSTLMLMRKWRNVNYRLTHFTGPLLEKPRKGICERLLVPGSGRRVGLAYPSWHLVPSGYRSSDDSAGGTIQGRITCTRPPAQTFPPWVKETFTSVFPNGVLLEADSSQIELRVAALLSGDPFMGSWFKEGADPHGDTTHLIFDEFGITEDDPEWEDVYRQVGKHSNFRLIYGGGIEKFQGILWHFLGDKWDVGKLFPYEKCLAIDTRLRQACHVYFRWKKNQPILAGQKGFLEVPTGWSRTFSGGVNVVQQTYANETANFPIQTLAAQLVLSAQYAVQYEMARRKLKSRICLNGYDALLFDCPPDEEAQIREIIDGPLKQPPLMAIIKKDLGRAVLLDYGVKRTVCKDTGGARP